MDTDRPSGADGSNDPRQPSPGPFDQIAEDLQRLRHASGMPSYNDLVVRITSQRESRGIASGAARPARTTVYDAFRPGRRRLDPSLVGDIVRALGLSDEDVAHWEARVALGHHVTTVDAPQAPQTPQVSVEPVVEVPAPRSPFSRPLPARRWVAAGLVGCVGFNLLGRITVDFLHLSIYLDMMGTAIAAILFGPWWGALVGLTTNVSGAALSGPTSIPFALVNIGGALVWGYGVRRMGLGRTVPRYFMLNLLVGLICTLLAAPIIVLLGGEAHHSSDEVISNLLATTHDLIVSVFAVNLLTSAADKVISGFVALVVAETLGRPFLELHREREPDQR